MFATARGERQPPVAIVSVCPRGVTARSRFRAGCEGGRGWPVPSAPVADAWGDLTIDGRSRAPDHQLLGLVPDGPGQATFELTRPLARFDGKLFGGTAIAVAVALAEVETARPALWTTVQFIAGDTTVGDRFQCTTEVLAEGRSAAQVRVTARVDGREVFCALGATAHRKAGRVEAAFERFPVGARRPRPPPRSSSRSPPPCRPRRPRRCGTSRCGPRRP